MIRSAGSLGGIPGKPADAISTFGGIGASRTPATRGARRTKPRAKGSAEGGFWRPRWQSPTPSSATRRRRDCLATAARLPEDIGSPFISQIAAPYRGAQAGPSSEFVKELASGWISAVRPSRQPLRGFLRMRTFINAIKDIPHAEERLKGASRSTHDGDADLVRWLRQIFYKLSGIGFPDLAGPLRQIGIGRDLDRAAQTRPKAPSRCPPSGLSRQPADCASSARRDASCPARRHRSAPGSGP
jgi:hypothetical protein